MYLVGGCFDKSTGVAHTKFSRGWKTGVYAPSGGGGGLLDRFVYMYQVLNLLLSSISIHLV
eukprot:SAG31_NODE_6396_length_2034_cov_3.180362_1_plen_61_part_00